MYRRIADIRSEDGASDVIDELIDRYGEPPESVKGLITVSLIRNSAIRHKIYEIGQKGNTLMLYSDHISPGKVSPLIKAMRGRVVISATAKQYIAVKIANNENVLDLLRLIMSLMDKAEENNQNNS